jgi:hypothetical protein
MGVDAIIDMARTAVNAIGNCLASAVIARWEGELQEPARLKLQETNSRTRFDIGWFRTDFDVRAKRRPGHLSLIEKLIPKKVQCVWS